jgi:hypothetical protein
MDKVNFERDMKNSFTNRRGFLGKLGLTAAGVVVAGQQEAEASIFSWLNPIPVPGIPDSWVRAKGSAVQSYARYIRGLGLKNITPYMVLHPHFKTRGSVKNSLPPRSSWRKIAPTLKLVDKMSSKMGVPVREISSAYRSPTYNRACRGNSKSYHMKNMALDIQFDGASPSHVASYARKMRSQREFKGGIGRYYSFTHIDTRGYNADW